MNRTIPSQDLRDKKLRKNPTCSKCHKRKTVADFPKGVLDYWCMECRREYAKALYHKKRNSLSQSELKKLKSRINRRQKARRTRAISQMTATERAAYRDRVNEENRKRRDQVRDLVYRAYGGYRCACCGETESKFLTIDHIYNDGAKHKREHRLRTGEQMYRWLIRNRYPKGFQILCMNCNWGKRNNNGVCPHSGKV